MTEKDCVKKLRARLKHEGYTSYCIETGLTVKGFPDLFIEGKGNDCFVEVKYLNRKNPIKQIPWRPGQQKWALDYYNAHNKKKCSLTVVFTQSLVYVVQMKTFWSSNYVTLPHPDIQVYHETAFRALNFGDILMSRTIKEGE